MTFAVLVLGRSRAVLTDRVPLRRYFPCGTPVPRQGGGAARPPTPKIPRGKTKPPQGETAPPTRGRAIPHEGRRRFPSTSVSPDSPDSPDCEIAAKRKVRWTWICQSSEPGESVKRAFRPESVKRAFRPGLSHRYLTDIAPPPPSLRSEKGENKNGIGRFRKKSSAFRPMFSGVRREKRTFFQRWHFWGVTHRVCKPLQTRCVIPCLTQAAANTLSACNPPRCFCYNTRYDTL